MSKYINDPREMAICPESGVTFEEDNRVEKMYHWGAKVLDLCDLPVSEYMKSMTVIIGGSNPQSGDTGVTKVNVNIKVSVVTPNGDIIDKDGNIIGSTAGDGAWKVRWSWNNNFNGILASSVLVYDNESNQIYVNSTIEDNSEREFKATIDSISHESIITGIGECTIGRTQETATGSTITIEDKDNKKEYEIEIKPSSGDEPIDGTIYCSFLPKPIEIAFDNMNVISSYDAKGDGVEINFQTNSSEEYIIEAEKFDSGKPPYDGDDAEEIWAEFVEVYEDENRYVLRIYIPYTIENNYDYHLYNDNAGVLTEATLVKTGVEKQYENVTYSEYVNENDAYLYDDVDNRSFKLRFIITEKQ